MPEKIGFFDNYQRMRGKLRENLRKRVKIRENS